MKALFITFLSLILSFGVLFGQQDAKLAQYYYQSGEYEKSGMLYKKLSDQAGFNEYYFNQYIESLMALEEYEKAGQQIESALSRRPDVIQLYVTRGNLYERLALSEEADEQYRQAIARLSNHQGQVRSLGNSFLRLAKYDLALEAFEKGEELSNNSGAFAYNIAEIYRRKNNKEMMIHYYLNSQMANSRRMPSVQSYFNRFLTEKEDYELLRKKLYEKVQDDPDNIFYPEMIQWVFIQNKAYDRALRQARALDRRLAENGSRVYSIAQIASNAKDYDTAIDGYQYIVDSKDETSSFFIEAKKELLKNKRRKLTQAQDYQSKDLASLKTEYNAFLDDMGKNKRTALIILEFAELNALYLNDLDTAVILLSELLDFPGLNNYVRANAKLDLADYHLMNGEVWESTLLYSQVDKEFREDHLGELARFKNAKLSYYIGDFEWAQEQFDILKSATTRLISNDAIDLSVFIMDNANLDTTYAPLQLFAEAELLFFQNRNEEAFSKLDSINLKFPGHTLADDVYFVKAESFTRQKKYTEASQFYQKIIEDHSEEIRADNAIFGLAQLYQHVLGRPEEAKDLYEKLFVEYSDSTFAIDARKQFRTLRGDNIQ